MATMSMQRATMADKHNNKAISNMKAAIPAKHKKVIGEMKAALAAEKMSGKAAHLFCVDDQEAQEGAETKKTTCTKKTTYTRGLIQNFAPGDQVVVLSNKDWSGKVIGCYQPIAKGNRKGYNHKGNKDDPDGSKGAVVYAGKSGRDVTENDLAWLLAWHAPPYANAQNTVYVECGDINKYNNINWDDIKTKLDASTSNEGYYYDNDTGADISVDIDATGLNPSLAAVFDVKN